MRTITFKRNTLFAFIAICLIITGIAVAFGTENFRTIGAYAMESKEAIGCEGIEEIDREIDLSLTEEQVFEEFENSMMLSGGGGRSGDAQLISGTNNFTDPFSTIALGDLTNAKYISNANYFLINPRHFPNDGNNNLNSAGVCTTDALQMLMGYHNYIRTDA